MRRARRLNAWLVLTGLAAAAFALPTSGWASPSAYVTNNVGHSVSQYNLVPDDGLTPNSPPTVALTGNPLGVSVSPDAKSLYIVGGGVTSKVWQYDIAANGTLSPKNPASVDAGGSPSDMALSPDGKSAYVPNAGASNISQFDVGAGGKLTPKSPATVAAGSFPGGIVVSPDGDSAYVANEGGATISQYDVDADGKLSAKAAATAATGSTPRDIAISDAGDVYTANAGGTVSQLFPDPTSNDELLPYSPPTVAAGVNTSGVMVSPDGQSVYAVNTGDGLGNGSISQFDVAGGGDGRLSPKSPATVAAGLIPRGIVASPNGEVVYVANGGDDNVSQYAAAADGTLAPKSPATVPAGDEPFAIAVRPDTIGPTTTITGGPSGTVTSPNARFAFSSNEPGSDFQCRIDGGGFIPCGSPKSYADLAIGAHSFAVRATDFTGNSGPAATRRWTVQRSTVQPSNEFEIGAATPNKKKGTAELTIEVPGPGEVELGGPKVRRATAHADEAGEVTLRVKAAGKARKKLRKKGKAKVTVEVTFTPDGGVPNTQSESLKLVRK